MCIRVYGLIVELRVNCPHLLGRLIDYFPPGWTYGPLNVVPDRRYGILDTEATEDVVGWRDFRYGFEVDDCSFTATDSEFELSTEFESDLHHYLAVHAKDHLFVQAGVVGWQGQAIVLPGRSHTGKTALVAELMRLGAVYFSDESAVFNRDDLVVPYPRALYIPAKSGPPRTRCSALDFGADVGEEPISPGLFVFTEYREDAVWEPKVITADEARTQLLAHAHRECAETILAGVAGGAMALSGHRGEAARAARDIVRICDEM